MIILNILIMHKKKKSDTFFRFIIIMNIIMNIF